jgi:hypothetical protein
MKLDARRGKLFNQMLACKAVCASDQNAHEEVPHVGKSCGIIPDLRLVAS